MLITFLVTAVFGLCMLMAAYKDLTSYTIPNIISLILLVAFFALSPFMGLSWAEFGTHVGVFAGSLAVMMAMFAAGWIGGGDAKLFAATAIWWMPYDLMVYTFYTAMAGGALAIALVMSRKFLPQKVQTTGWVHTLLRDEKKMPYGLALAFAAMITLPVSQIYMNLPI